MGSTIYSYDKVDRLTSISDPRLGDFSATINDLTGSSTFTRPSTGSAIVTSASIDLTTGQLKTLTHTVGSTSIAAFGFSFDPAGNLKTLSTTRGNHDFQYDANTQLKSASNPEVGTPGGHLKTLRVWPGQNPPADRTGC